MVLSFARQWAPKVGAKACECMKRCRLLQLLRGAEPTGVPVTGPISLCTAWPLRHSNTATGQTLPKLRDARFSLATAPKAPRTHGCRCAHSGPHVHGQTKRRLVAPFLAGRVRPIRICRSGRGTERWGPASAWPWRLPPCGRPRGWSWWPWSSWGCKTPKRSGPGSR